MSQQLQSHSSTIIHIDLDCFYAQVEMNKNPDLCDKPVGIQQKNIVVTSNYKAREYGVTKCMLISDAYKACPDLILVNGEDLHDYRQASYQVTSYLQRYSSLVERLGFDENYIDVTQLVEKRLQESEKLVGNVFGDFSESCQCGCRTRLILGSMIAQDIRDGLKNDLKLTSCAGIAHNKLLAKLAGAVNKPNQQTLVFPNSALELILNLKLLRNIPGIGASTAGALEEIGVSTIEGLQNCDFGQLKATLGLEKAKLLKNLSFGNDESLVKATGRPQSIGIEDSCKLINAEAEVREKFSSLLGRLMILVSEDGRVPRTLKLTARKVDKINKLSHRETRQCNISPILFSNDKNGKSIFLTENSENKLMATIMHLFSKLVDVTKPYHVTLLGLSFTKFQERTLGRGSIASFLRKDISVQSVTSIVNEQSQNSNFGEHSRLSLADSNTDGSESELEPSPKKSKFGMLIAKRRCLGSIEDCASPSKLRVAELRLNSMEMDRPDLEGEVSCPPTADHAVFQQLPTNIQKELWDDWKRERDREEICQQVVVKKPKMNTLLNYFVKN